MKRAAFLLLCLTILWALDAALGTTVFAVHDLRTHHLPWRAWASSEWLHGRVPLWAPGVANGFPLLAEGQTGAFYPPTLILFALLPPTLALNASILLHVWLAGMGTFVLARALGRSDEASLFGAIAFAFGGFLATHALYLGMHHAVAWLPWILWALHENRRAWLASFIFFLLVAGHVQAACFALLLVLACAVAWRRYATFTLAGGVGVALSLPQLLATRELVSLSARQHGLTPDLAAQGSLPPQELLNAVAPKLFGIARPVDVAESYHQRGSGYWGAGVNHWEMSFYLGIPVAFLALAMVRDRAMRFWWGVSLVAVLLMLGDHTPLWPILRWLPGLDGFRFPVRFALVLSLSMVVIASYGLDRVLEIASAAQARLGRRALGLAAILLAVVVVAHESLRMYQPDLERLLVHWFENQVRPPVVAVDPSQAFLAPAVEPLTSSAIVDKVRIIVASLLQSTSLESPQVLVPVGALLGLGAGLHALSAQRIGAYGFTLLVTALLATDLFWFGSNYQGRVSRRWVESRPMALDVIEAGPEGRVTVVDRRVDTTLDVELVSANLGLLYGLRDVIIPSPLLLQRNEAFLQRVGLDIGDRGEVKVARLDAHKPLVDLLGVRWLLSVHELRGDGLVRRLQGQVNLYENEAVMPRVFLVGCVEETADPYARLDALDPRQWALVESSVDLPGCRDGAGSGQAWITREAPQEIVVGFTATRPALLVSTETWYPGWEAWLDGERVDILRADYLFRGVEVPAGSHEIVFRYRPTWRGWAIVFSTMGMAGLGLLATFGRVRR